MPSVSKSQQRYMGMVHACKKSGKCASAAVKKTASSMKTKDAKEFASTKHTDLPEKKRKSKMKEAIRPTFIDYLSEMGMEPEVGDDAMALYQALSMKGQAMIRHYMQMMADEEGGGDVEGRISQEYDSEEDCGVSMGGNDMEDSGIVGTDEYGSSAAGGQKNWGRQYA